MFSKPFYVFKLGAQGERILRSLTVLRFGLNEQQLKISVGTFPSANIVLNSSLSEGESVTIIKDNFPDAVVFEYSGSDDNLEESIHDFLQNSFSQILNQQHTEVECYGGLSKF